MQLGGSWRAFKHFTVNADLTYNINGIFKNTLKRLHSHYIRSTLISDLDIVSKDLHHNTMTKKKLCCVGHITKDKIITPKNEFSLSGGTAFYFAHAINAFT